jgi:hypothetical protein
MLRNLQSGRRECLGEALEFRANPLKRGDCVFRLGEAIDRENDRTDARRPAGSASRPEAPARPSGPRTVPGSPGRLRNLEPLGSSIDSRLSVGTGLHRDQCGGRCRRASAAWAAANGASARLARCRSFACTRTTLDRSIPGDFQPQLSQLKMIKSILSRSSSCRSLAALSRLLNALQDGLFFHGVPPQSPHEV